ncbi:hypothetical protein M0802_010090 [Mischocyttarus mexicanus]|nr:hypothetical protein M0802_010090 [Mischocyttarus mexicanus]
MSSTSCKDYTWPYPIKQKDTLPTDKDEIIRIGPCTCGMDPKDLQVPRMYGEKYDWSRVGPMGPLLDPKLYPAKTGPSPETEETRIGQPDVYLKKLEEKYPYLYGVIQGGPSRETIMEVEKDRMMTTASSTLDTGWNHDLQSHALRSTASSNIYQSNTCPSDHDFKRSEEKTSEETILVEVDGNIDDYSVNTDTKNVPIKQKTDTLLGRNHRYLYDYPNLNVTQAMLAMQKLQKFKELQRKRDQTEKYYSNEIRKLIGDYFNSNTRTELSPLKYYNNNNNSRIQRANLLQPYLGDRLKDDLKSLEPCGTMTTITRLDCGCIQETTRPIFTTTTGRVQKKMCNQSQDQVLLKLTSSNPQEYLLSSLELNNSEQCSLKSKKKRVEINSRKYGLNSIDDDVVYREIGKEHDCRNNPRNVRALRKYSDTSTTSI